MRELFRVLTGLALFLSVSPALAVDGDAARGHTFARQYCSRCHAVERHKLKSPVREAPPFATLGRYRPLETLSTSLSEAMTVGHANFPMPVFQLGPQETADLIAYLRTIQEPEAASPAKP